MPTGQWVFDPNSGGKKISPTLRKLQIYQVLWKVDEDDDLEAYMKLPLEAVVSEWQYHSLLQSGYRVTVMITRSGLPTAKGACDVTQNEKP